MLLSKLLILVPVLVLLLTRDSVLELCLESAFSLLSFGLTNTGSRLACFNGGNALIGLTVNVLSYSRFLGGLHRKNIFETGV